MYSYQKLLNPNEKVYFFGGMHWIMMSGSFAMLVIMTWAGLMMDKYLHTRFHYPTYSEVPFVWHNLWSWLSWLPVAFIAVGVFWVLCDAIRYMSTRVMLTSHRIITKRGWIMVKIDEVELEEIKAAHIDQMLLGRMLGYGKVLLDARFVQDDTLPLMARPFDLLKLIHVVRDQHLGEKDDKTHELTSEDLPFIEAKPEIKSEDDADDPARGEMLDFAEKKHLVPNNKATGHDATKDDKDEGDQGGDNSSDGNDDDAVDPDFLPDDQPQKADPKPAHQAAPPAEDGENKGDATAENVTSLGLTQEDVKFLHEMRKDGKTGTK